MAVPLQFIEIGRQENGEEGTSNNSSENGNYYMQLLFIQNKDNQNIHHPDWFHFFIFQIISLKIHILTTETFLSKYV